MKYTKDDFTEDWKKYELGKQWNRKLPTDYYETVTTNWEMFNGNQWINADGVSDEFPQPVFNIIKRALMFFIASITSRAITGQYTLKLGVDDDFEGLETASVEVASQSFKNFLETNKADMMARDLLMDAGVSGDMAVHMYFDTEAKPYGDTLPILGQIEIEIVDGNNVYFGNPNNRRVNKQPYILIYGRSTIDEIKEEIKLHRKLKNVDELVIAPDNDNEEQASDAGKIEIDSDDYGKVGYVIKYCFKTGKGGKKTIHVSKSLSDQIIYKDIDTGLNRYPIAFNNWEHQKNQYHGRAMVTDIVPNQIFINRMFAMAMYHLQMTAFPKAIFNADRIAGWSNEVGVAIGIRGVQPNENIFNLAGYLQPSQMSPQIMQLIDMTIAYTKEMIGANDALLGDINPEQASGAAISVTAKQSGVPLTGPKANLTELFEDVMLIYADMAGTYYGSRPVVVNDDEGRKIVDFDFSAMKDLQYNTKMDVGATSFFDEQAMQATMDNLLSQGLIEFTDYLDSMPEGYVPNKQKLIASAKQKAEAMKQQAMAQQQMQAPPMPQIM